MKRSFIYSFICALLISACAPAQAWSFNGVCAAFKNKTYTISACVAAVIGASFMWCWYKKSQKKVNDLKPQPEATVQEPQNTMEQQIAERKALFARIRKWTPSIPVPQALQISETETQHVEESHGG